MPLERAFANLSSNKLSPDHEATMAAALVDAQRVWNEHEAAVRTLFEHMYRTRLDVPTVDAYVSGVVPNPISEPVVVRMRDADGFRSHERQVDFMAQLLHQLTHWFYETGRAPTLKQAVATKLPEATEDAALHVVLHGTDFAIVGELFGHAEAERLRLGYVDGRNPDYRYAARQLVSWGVPLDRTALDVVESRVA